MDKTIKKLSDYIKTNNLISVGDRILAGVSGGADSVCLLAVLCELRNEYGLSLKVVHINHGIRRETALRDERFTAELCRELGVEYECVSGDIPRIAAQTHTGCEEAGRNFRYETFGRLAEEGNFNKIAIAHNSDDNAETVLFNIFRGSGLSGIRGIRPSRSMGSSWIIRPILCLSRAEIEEFLNKRNISWCTDETNLENDYSRNVIRNCIMPTVREELNSAAVEHIAGLSAQAAELEDFLHCMVEEEVKKCQFSYADDIGAAGDKAAAGATGATEKEFEAVSCRIEDSHINSLHPVVQKALIRECFGRLSKSLKDVENVHIGQIAALTRNQVGRKLNLPYGIEAEKSYDAVILRKKTENLSKCIENNIEITYTVRPKSGLSAEFPKNDCIQWFDYDKIQNGLQVRCRQAGDYILIGKGALRKALNRYMIDAKIPAELRDSLLLLADGSHILWIPGYRRDDSCYVTEETKTVLIAEISKKG